VSNFADQPLDGRQRIITDNYNDKTVPAPPPKKKKKKKKKETRTRIEG